MLSIRPRYSLAKCRVYVGASQIGARIRDPAERRVRWADA